MRLRYDVCSLYLLNKCKTHENSITRMHLKGSSFVMMWRVVCLYWLQTQNLPHRLIVYVTFVCLMK